MRRVAVPRLLLVLFASVLALGALAPGAAGAQEPTPPPQFEGQLVSGSIPSDGGFGVVVFGGGSFEQLVTASGCPASRVVFWVTRDGQFLVYIPASTVAAPSADFRAAFPDNFIPPLTPLLGRCMPGVSASGVQGVVTRGPMCPVETVTNPCPDEPYRATLVFLDANKREVARIASSAIDGRYRVALVPGRYTIVPLVPTPPFPSASPVDVTVEAGRFATVNVRYDTGIR